MPCSKKNSNKAKNGGGGGGAGGDPLGGKVYDPRLARAHRHILKELLAECDTLLS